MAYLVKQSHRAPAQTVPVSVDESLPRACVIGAGSSGITAAKHLYLAGIPFDCFEMGHDIGGTWVLDNSNGQSACYDSLEINTSCPRMAYSDFPMPADYPPYARHDQVAAYFDQYVDHFGFRHTITFDTTVEDVSRTADGRWDVRVTGPGGTETRAYDAVLVANGHHWDPRWPEPAYPGTFDGDQLHAHDYRSADQVEGRDVVVVGAGNSAMDIAVDASATARTTTWSVRRSEWVLRKFFLGRPSDQVALPGWMPWRVTAARLRLGATVAGSLTKYGLPDPSHKPGQSHPVQSEKIRDRLEAGAVTAKPGIERLDGDRVVFVDGSSVPADLIVWATGYRVSFPFLDPDLVSAPGNELPLWKRTVHPDLPGLYFLGLLQAIGAVMPLAEAQSAWIADTLTGRYVPPSDAVVRRQMAAEHARDRRQFYDSPRHTMEVDFDHYLWDLQRERKAGRARAAASRTSSVEPTAPVPAATGGGGVRRTVARLALRAVGWRTAGEVPERGVLVGAPHTSNWDWVLTLLLGWSYGITIRLLVKKELFIGPLGWLLRRTGAVELDRKNPSATIKELIAEAEGGAPWLLGLAAEGTRSRGDYWKSGFYRIARQTGLPITLAFLDVPSRTVGWGPTFHPTGDVGADMDVVREFYADKTGFHPEGFTPPRLREEERDTLPPKG
ncbi:NAD(P)-binding domain-containing protein [Nocardioides sp. S-58]|uniref:NAD(P)-binding domain-containing protein n=1 Tax=Nocardioides renjunii TaxID=3095075 RepID=A0ABU5K5S4_9ACTN|nr:NAD(P)-binding domain-containing protein [Nocardioides sp. S-58]MDZ5660226.1 NAD(P)-binding domain-containing protein [Nocardioides sp. S-58]